MADRTVADQPSVLTIYQLREQAAELPAYEQDGPLGMLDEIERSAKGSEAVFTLEDDSPVRYVHDGNGMLFRADTKPAEVLRRSADRAVAKHG